MDAERFSPDPNTDPTFQVVPDPDPTLKSIPTKYRYQILGVHNRAVARRFNHI